jgi:hypothetical protein
MIDIDTDRIPDARQQPLMLLWPDAGRALGISRATSYSAASRGELPTVKIGRRLYVRVASLRQLLGLDAEPASSGQARGEVLSDG